MKKETKGRIRAIISGVAVGIVLGWVVTTTSACSTPQHTTVPKLYIYEVQINEKPVPVILEQ